MFQIRTQYPLNSVDYLLEYSDSFKDYQNTPNLLGLYENTTQVFKADQITTM